MHSAPVPINTSIEQHIITDPEKNNSICAKTQPDCIYTASGELICGINKAKPRESCPEDYAKVNNIKYMNNNYFATFT